MSDGLCGLGFILIPVFLSEEKRHSGSLSLQWREGVQVPSPFRGEKVFRLPLHSKERRYSGSLSSEDKRCSDPLSLQRLEDAQIPSPQRGGRVIRFPLPSGERVRVRGNRAHLLLRCKRLIYPCIKLLLVGFDPAINVTLDIGLRRFTRMHHCVLGVDIRQRQLH